MVSTARAPGAAGKGRAAPPKPVGGADKRATRGGDGDGGANGRAGHSRGSGASGEAGPAVVYIADSQNGASPASGGGAGAAAAAAGAAAAEAPAPPRDISPVPPGFFVAEPPCPLTTRAQFDTGAERDDAAEDERERSRVVLPAVRKVYDLGPDGYPIVINPSTTGGSRIEELTDDKFERRHYPSEVAERRHKKFGHHSTVFELQMERRRRLEEEKARKEREERGLIEPEPEAATKKVTRPFSFWPIGACGPAIGPDELREVSICVTDRVPVVAFGVPVPAPPPQHAAFALPPDGDNAFVLRNGGRLPPASKRRVAASDAVRARSTTPGRTPVKRSRREVAAPERFSYDDRVKDLSKDGDADGAAG